MVQLGKSVRRFIENEEGAALAEYGILVAFIAIVAITAVTFFGSSIAQIRPSGTVSMWVSSGPVRARASSSNERVR